MCCTRQGESLHGTTRYGFARPFQGEEVSRPAPYMGDSIQDPASELPRTPIPRRSVQKLRCARLEPAAVLEDQVERAGGQQHEHQRERVPEGPVQLRHVLEVHPVDGAYERRGEQYGRPSADLLDLIVLGYAGFAQGLDLLVLGEAYQC